MYETSKLIEENLENYEFQENQDKSVWRNEDTSESKKVRGDFRTFNLVRFSFNLGKCRKSRVTKKSRKWGKLELGRGSEENNK